jgi:hypothetical protein
MEEALYVNRSYCYLYHVRYGKRQKHVYQLLWQQQNSSGKAISSPPFDGVLRAKVITVVSIHSSTA